MVLFKNCFQGVQNVSQPANMSTVTKKWYIYFR